MNFCVSYSKGKFQVSHPRCAAFNHTRCDQKIRWMFSLKKFLTVKDTLPLIPLASNTLIPSFLPLSEAVLEVLFRECLYLRCRGCLDVLNRFKTFTFHGHFDFGEEPEVARCQTRWIRWMRTHSNIFDRNCRTRRNVWHGALSWWRTHSPRVQICC